PHRHVNHSTITHVTDVWLRVYCDGRLFPRLQLLRCHCYRGSLCSYVVGKVFWRVAGVSLAPEAILHQVYPFDQGIPVELGGEQFNQLCERFLKFRMVVARFPVLSAAFSMDLPDIREWNALPQERRKGYFLWLK